MLGIETSRREGAMGVSIIERSKEGTETDAKKQRRNYKIAMISDREVGCKIDDVEDETDLGA
jgi:hypothetical protein